MDQVLPQKTQGKPRILVAPLDWGLGHATRCIPLIKELEVNGAEVILAGEAAQKALLSAEFPHLQFLPLKGYRIRYSKNASGLPLRLLFQVSKIKRTIREENRWLKDIISQHKIDAVISDNRYGLYHKSIPSVFITHQLRIKTNWGGWTETLLQNRNYRYLNKFSACWIPDEKGEKNLAGQLSHPVKLPRIPIHYIGPLSRFKEQGSLQEAGHLLILLSGPEPQRSILEEKILKEVAHYQGEATIVRGLPDHHSVIPSTNMIHCYNHLPADELQEKFRSASFVISRSGYSTIMDAMRLKKKCIFIPTPGQTEQEYLGAYLSEKQIALSIPQTEFSLKTSLELAAQYDYRIPEFNFDGVKEMAARFVRSLQK